MKKPSYFRWDDFFLWGGLTILLAVLTLVVFVAGDVQVGGEPAGIWPKLGMLLTTAGFLFVYLMVLRARKKALLGFWWINTGRYGMMVNSGDYRVTQKELVELTNDTLLDWEAVLPGTLRKLYYDQQIFWVWFKPHPIEEKYIGKVAGYVIPRSNRMFVSYRSPTQPLAQTAYQHELGHLIQGHVTNNWDQDTHHMFAKEHGLK